MTTVREKLYQAIEALPDEELENAVKILEYLIERQSHANRHIADPKSGKGGGKPGKGSKEPKLPDPEAIETFLRR